jgi:glyoxylase-like metal-dependent hydrolase (beta-lactamase superfamily II)
MKPVKIGDVSVSSIIEREGPWRAPNIMFPSATPEQLTDVMSLVPDFAYDRAKDLLCITYQTFVLRTPRCTALIDTCVGEHQRRPPALLFDKKPWLDGFAQHGLKFEDIDYVFCTHLHIDHTGWNTTLRDGRWVPTFPNASTYFTRRNMRRGRRRMPRAPTRPARSSATIACQSSRPGRRFWLTTITRSTIPLR